MAAQIQMSSYKKKTSGIRLKILHFAAAVAPVVLYKAVARVHNENTTLFVKYQGKNTE